MSEMTAEERVKVRVLAEGKAYVAEACVSSEHDDWHVVHVTDDEDSAKEAKRSMGYAITDAESAQRKPMACGHPQACWRHKEGSREPYCQACKDVADENKRICGLVIKRVQECGCRERHQDGTECGDCEVFGELLVEFQQRFADASEEAESEVPE